MPQVLLLVDALVDCFVPRLLSRRSCQRSSNGLSNLVVRVFGLSGRLLGLLCLFCVFRLGYAPVEYAPVEIFCDHLLSDRTDRQEQRDHQPSP